MSVCTLCHEAVEPEDRRDHLIGHHPGAETLTAREVAEFFLSEF